MILVPGITRCPACGQFVFFTDNLYIAEPYAGVERIEGFASGAYHDVHFQSLPWHDDYIAVQRAVRNAALDEPNEFLAVLDRTETLALTRRPFTSAYTLYFLARGVQLNFRDPEAWQQFVGTARADGPRPTPASDGGSHRLRALEGEWEISVREPIPVQLELSPADLGRIHEHLDARATDPTRTPIALGTLCQEMGIRAVSPSCPLDRLKGTFAWPQTPEPTEQAVTIQVTVEKWIRLRISSSELQELRRFIHPLRQADA